MKQRKRTFMAVICMLCLILTLSLQVSAASASIKLNKKTATVEMGATLTLTAEVTGKSQKITWKSSNKKVATVDSNGKVTPIKAGKVTISAKANGKTAKCTVTVKNADYRKLYKKFLEKSTIKVGSHTLSTDTLYYKILNINKSGVPELIVCPNGLQTQTCLSYYVYTVKNNKVKYVGTCSYFGRYSTPILYYSSKQKAIKSYALGMGYESHGLYCISNSKLKTKRICESMIIGSATYKTGSSFNKLKSASKSAYNNYYKSYFKGLKKYTMAKNTAANRKKILSL